MSNIFQNLPPDPEEAFLILEKHYRNELEESVRRADDEHMSSESNYVDYLAQVIAAIHILGIESSFGNKLPEVDGLDFDAYLKFSKDFKYYRAKLEIRSGRRVQGYSVRFDLATKGKVRHHIAQIRTIFEQLEVEDRKREALFSKLSDLESEVDRDRTRFDVYAALSIEVAGIVGEVAEKSKFFKIMDSIGRVIWGAKEEEAAKQLPPPAKPKQIEPPRAPKPKPQDFTADPDDEIPF